MSIELRDFVSTTLIQIITGIKNAQKDESMHDSGAAICPIGQSTTDSKVLNQAVNFDITVNAESSRGTQGGIGIFVGPVGVGSKGQSQSAGSSQNRIQFTVPVYLPGQKITRPPQR
jgi:hypothetical protein